MSSESVQATAQRFLGSFRRTESKLFIFGRCYPMEAIIFSTQKIIYAVQNLLKAVTGPIFLKTGSWENLMKKDLEIFSFSC